MHLHQALWQWEGQELRGTKDDVTVFETAGWVSVQHPNKITAATNGDYHPGPHPLRPLTLKDWVPKLNEDPRPESCRSMPKRWTSVLMWTMSWPRARLVWRQAWSYYVGMPQSLPTGLYGGYPWGAGQEESQPAILHLGHFPSHHSLVSWWLKFVIKDGFRSLPKIKIKHKIKMNGLVPTVQWNRNDIHLAHTMSACYPCKETGLTMERKDRYVEDADI